MRRLTLSSLCPRGDSLEEEEEDEESLLNVGAHTISVSVPTLKKK